MDIINTLPNLSWRGVELPYTSASIGFAHESDQRKFIFRDQSLIVQLGQRNPTYRYSVPFLESLTTWEGIFTEKFQAFFDSCVDREPGELVDPLRGKLRAVVASVSVELNPTEHRDGVLVEVEFVHAPEFTESADATTLQEVEVLGRKATEAMPAEFTEAVQAFIDSNAELVSVASDQAFAAAGQNPLDAITGLVAQGQLYSQKIDNQLSKEIHRVSTLQKAVNSFKSTEKWGFLDANADYKKGLIDLKKANRSNNSRTIAIQAPYDIFPSVLAGMYSMTVEEFLKLNPDLTDPIIPYGTFCWVKKLERAKGSN